MTPSDSLLNSIRSFLFQVRAPEPDFAAEQERMVFEELAIPGREISDRRVLAAMAKVPRHEFVPAGMRGEAYADHSLLIGQVLLGRVSFPSALLHNPWKLEQSHNLAERFVIAAANPSAIRRVTDSSNDIVTSTPKRQVPDHRRETLDPNSETQLEAYESCQRSRRGDLLLDYRSGRAKLSFPMSANLAAEEEVGVPVEHQESVLVMERFHGDMLWEGNVEVFKISKAPHKRLFGWAVMGKKGPEWVFVLESEDIDSAASAVRHWVMAHRRET